MLTNSLEKYEGGFFRKLRRLVKNIFYSKKSDEKKILVKEDEIISKESIEPQNNLIHNIKAESQKVALKEDILELVKKNPNILETLSIEKLKELDKMYDEKIEKNAKEIEYLEIKLKGYKIKLS